MGEGEYYFDSGLGRAWRFVLGVVVIFFEAGPVISTDSALPCRPSEDICPGLFNSEIPVLSCKNHNTASNRTKVEAIMTCFGLGDNTGQKCALSARFNWEAFLQIIHP